jgi:SAM-dependent methyltransferase
MWVTENQMGPNPLWLTEFLLEELAIEPGMRVLDLGCGKALTSVFLARETGAHVTAMDLWIPAADNQQRIAEADVADLVTPIHAEAHTMPFAAGFFDAIISIDAYQYFGTNDLYLGYLADFLKPGGRLDIVVPALTSELGDEVPETLAPYWEWDFCCWHGPDWWRHHWTKTGKVTVDHADYVPEMWKDWLQFNSYIAPHVEGWWVEDVKNTHEMLEADRGTNLSFARVVATRA